MGRWIRTTESAVWHNECERVEFIAFENDCEFSSDFGALMYG